MNKECLDLVSELCGYKLEVLGGGVLGWIVDIDPKVSLVFGFANGGLGYTLSSVDGAEIESGEIPQDKPNAVEMAHYILQVVRKIKHERKG